MKPQTKEIRTMQKAAISHAKSLRWILKRLDNLGSEPRITSIRVNSLETTFVTYRGTVHNPGDWKALRGKAPKIEEIEEKEGVQGPEEPLPRQGESRFELGRAGAGKAG